MSEYLVQKCLKVFLELFLSWREILLSQRNLTHQRWCCTLKRVHGYRSSFLSLKHAHALEQVDNHLILFDLNSSITVIQRLNFERVLVLTTKSLMNYQHLLQTNLQSYLEWIYNQFEAHPNPFLHLWFVSLSTLILVISNQLTELLLRLRRN